MVIPEAEPKLRVVPESELDQKFLARVVPELEFRMNAMGFKFTLDEYKIMAK